jgi:hypothetical protein
MRHTEKRLTSQVEIATARRGVMLLLTLFFIVVATSLATLIMSNSSQLIRTTRHEHEAILLRQLTDSALAWARANDSLIPDAPITLNGEELLPEGISGEVCVNLDDKLQGVIVVTANIKFPGHDRSRTTRFRLP